MKQKIETIVSHFNIEGCFVDASPWGSGHINDTYVVIMEDPCEETATAVEVHYTLQRINHFVFKKPIELMQNAMAVSRHLAEKIKEAGGDPNRNTLNFLSTIEGEPLHIDEDGNYWRMYRFIHQVRGYDRIERPEIAYECGKAFGQFQSNLADFDSKKLHYTIDHFNDPVYLLQKFEEVLKADSHERASLAKRQIALVRERAHEMTLLSRLRESGDLPLRVVHNDTKANNVLIDTITDKAVCVIDLDTIMPGIALNDFGDSIRTVTNMGEEDDPDLTCVGVDLVLFEAYTRGFLKYTKSFLTPLEVAHLAFAGKLYPFLIGLRFLTDFLDGDNYFKISHEHHNLQRCKAQFKLLTDMEENFEEMQLIVKRVYRETP